ncbi:MAG: hypothetical protein K8F91_25875 [Candidatus Obscuribacterales bacterium]|nr:hypothetical protein [Candidatus Obscuribacterales bacterium]
MRIVGYNFDSLDRHGVNPEMIDEVLQGSMVSYFSVEDADDTCEMLVGYTFAERLLEIGLRYRSFGTVYVFHAQSVSPQYRKLFEEDWKNG